MSDSIQNIQNRVEQTNNENIKINDIIEPNENTKTTKLYRTNSEIINDAFIKNEMRQKNKIIFNNIIKNYKIIKTNIYNISLDIDKLEKVHYNYVNNVENKLRFHEYGIYIDDIFYQVKILKMEYNSLIEIDKHNINKLYKDLYRIYCKLVKKLIAIHVENSNITLLIDKKHVKDKMNKEKSEYFSKIKPFNEIKNDIYTIEDNIILYDEIDLRLEEIIKSIDNINIMIDNVKEKSIEGFLLNTYLISLMGEKDKILIEYNIFNKLLDSIFVSHLYISNKYNNRTTTISNEVINDTEKITKINNLDK